MRFPNNSIIACVGSLLVGLSTQAAFSLEANFSETASNGLEISGELSLTQLQNRARAITVKIIAGRGWGSGILIKKQGENYTVLTNAHVIRIAHRYQIQTPDGKIYSAQQITTRFPDDDLALLNFRSANNYAIARTTSSSISVGDETFAAGFPDDEQGFAFTIGKVDYVLPQPFRDGYQLGYSNDIRKGMSGGPVLNNRGELIAVNGKHKHPLWGNSYIFKDGSTPVLTIRQQLENSSWAVPIQTFLRLAPQ